MKILIASDLHNEFRRRSNLLPGLPDPEVYDVVVLAGDIGSGAEGAFWATEFFPENKPIIYVNGNHEYYHHSLAGLKEAQELLSENRPNLHVLNPGTIRIDGVTFIGATMWSDLNLRGYEPISYSRVESQIADFYMIKAGEEVFSAKKMVEIHHDEINFIYDELNNSDGPCVVVTHFVPSQRCIHPRFAGSSLNPYFTNDCEWLMENPHYDLPLWIAGHTHDRYDLVPPETHNTRIVLNPRGYPGENSEAFEWKIVEVSNI